MRTKQKLIERLSTYTGAKYIYTDKGYIVWQESTGENVELLFIESSEKGKGYGKFLVGEMCKQIKPYHSVFVIRLASNEEAGNFYKGLGFKETLVKGLYQGDDAVIGVIPYETLCQNL